MWFNCPSLFLGRCQYLNPLREHIFFLFPVPKKIHFLFFTQYIADKIIKKISLIPALIPREYSLGYCPTEGIKKKKRNIFLRIIQHDSAVR